LRAKSSRRTGELLNDWYRWHQSLALRNQATAASLTQTFPPRICSLFQT